AELWAVGRAGDVTVERRLSGPFEPARTPSGVEDAARRAFEKLGNTSLELASLTLHNDAGVFVPVSQLNQLRRDLVADIEARLRERLAGRIAELARNLTPQPPSRSGKGEQEKDLTPNPFPPREGERTSSPPLRFGEGAGGWGS